MVSLYFGLPGAGKTTVLTSLALKYSQPFSKYRNVYHNVRSLNVPGTTYIDNECIGKYNLNDSLILIDEAQLFADNRDYAKFPKYLKEFFFGHRHDRVDICLFSQQWDATDKKIRSITDTVYYIYKGKFFGHWFSKYYKVPYGIIIPDPKKNSGSSQLGEIIQGYAKPPLLVRLFAKRLYRPKYYPYFNSFESIVDRPPLPDEYQQIPWTVPQLRQISFYEKYDAFIKMVYSKTVKPIKKKLKRIKKQFWSKNKKAA